MQAELIANPGRDVEEARDKWSNKRVGEEDKMDVVCYLMARIEAEEAEVDFVPIFMMKMELEREIG